VSCGNPSHRSQLIIFAVLTLIALVVLGWYYLRLPARRVLEGTRSQRICPRRAACTEHRT